MELILATLFQSFYVFSLPHNLGCSATMIMDLLSKVSTEWIVFTSKPPQVDRLAVIGITGPPRHERDIHPTGLLRKEGTSLKNSWEEPSHQKSAPFLE